MRRFDMHCHADSGDSEKWDIFAQAARENETIAAVVGGLRYGERDYLPNEEVLAQCRRHPDCLIPFAKLDLWETAAPDEVYRLAEQGFRGFQGIYPYYEYDHDIYMPVYEAIEKVGLPVFFHTSHPQLCGALRRSKKWLQTGAHLYGDNKGRSAASMRRSAERAGNKDVAAIGYGGHFRAVQAFKYIGENGYQDIGK